jgi:hypothetical protein
MTEVLIAMAVFGIIAGGLVTVYSMETSVAMREQDLSVKLTTERYSIAGVQNVLRRASPLKSLEVVTLGEALIRPMASDDHAIFLSGDQIIWERFITGDGDEIRRPLYSAADKLKKKEEGGLTFELPQNSADITPANYTLTMTVFAEGTTANYDAVMLAKHAQDHKATRRIALAVNPGEPEPVYPIKGGMITSGGAWVGEAIIFSSLRPIEAVSDKPPFPIHLLAMDMTMVPIASPGSVYKNLAPAETGTIDQGDTVEVTTALEKSFQDLREQMKAEGIDLGDLRYDISIEWYVTYDPSDPSTAPSPVNARKLVDRGRQKTGLGVDRLTDLALDADKADSYRKVYRFEDVNGDGKKEKIPYDEYYVLDDDFDLPADDNDQDVKLVALDKENPRYREITGSDKDGDGEADFVGAYYEVFDKNGKPVIYEGYDKNPDFYDDNGQPVVKDKNGYFIDINRVYHKATHQHVVYDEYGKPLPLREYSRIRGTNLDTGDATQTYFRIEDGPGEEDYIDVDGDGVLDPVFPYKDLDGDGFLDSVFLWANLVIDVYYYEDPNPTHIAKWGQNVIEILPPPDDGATGGFGFYDELREIFLDSPASSATDNSATAAADGAQLRDSKLKIDVQGTVGSDSYSPENLAKDGITTTLTRISGGQNQGLMGMYKKLNEDHLRDAISYEVAYGGKRDASGKLGESELYTGVAYTNAANFSILVDVMLGPGANPANGHSMTFGAAVKNLPTYFDLTAPNVRAQLDGYAVAYDYKGSGTRNLDSPANENIRMMFFENKAAPTTPSGKSPDNLHGVVFDRPYRPGSAAKDMDNSKYNFGGDKSGEGNWLGRKRIMYTMLEYYDTNTKQVNFIVRVKMLAPLRDPKKADHDNLRALEYARDKKDYFYVGEGFHLSEPIWFGGFVGSPVEDEGGLVAHNWNNWNKTPPGDIIPGAAANRSSYLVEPNQGTSAVFGRKAMKGTGVQLTGYIRDRYWGLSMMEGKDNMNLTVYSINLAPGFTDGELRAILPAGARMLNPAEIYPPETSITPDYINPRKGQILGGETSKRPDLNLHLFGPAGASDGRGNRGEASALPVGVNQIQYKHYMPFYMQDVIWQDR